MTTHESLHPHMQVAWEKLQPHLPFTGTTIGDLTSWMGKHLGEEWFALGSVCDINEIRPLLDRIAPKWKEMARGECEGQGKDSGGKPRTFRLVRRTGELAAKCEGENPMQLCWGKMRWHVSGEEQRIVCEGHFPEFEGGTYKPPPDTIVIERNGEMQTFPPVEKY